MNVFKSFWSAFANLARSLNGLAETIDAVGLEVRQRAGVGVLEGNPVPQLPNPTANGNGDGSPMLSAGKRSRKGGSLPSAGRGLAHPAQTSAWSSE